MNCEKNNRTRPASDLAFTPTVKAIQERPGSRKNYERMERVEIYTKSWCGFCSRAKRLLDAKGIEYTEYDVTSDRELEHEMIERSNRRTVPQIFIGGLGIGGSRELTQLESMSRLDRLLEETDDSDGSADRSS